MDTTVIFVNETKTAKNKKQQIRYQQLKIRHSENWNENKTRKGKMTENESEQMQTRYDKNSQLKCYGCSMMCL